MGFSLFGDDSPRENHEIGLYWTAWRRFTSGMLVLTSVVSKFHVFFFWSHQTNGLSLPMPILESRRPTPNSWQRISWSEANP